MRCPVLCKGTYTSKMLENCGAYNISFNLNKTPKTKFFDFRCEITGCILGHNRMWVYNLF